MRGCGLRRLGYFVLCLAAILLLLHLELGSSPPSVVLLGGGRPSPFATVLPCTVNDAQWLVAKILSCSRTLSERNTRVVMVMLPARDVAAMRSALRDAQVELPAHWHLVPESDILPWTLPPPLHYPRIPGWNLQQALKLLAHHHPLVTRATPPIDYILTIDSDVVCAMDWDHDAPLGRAHAASGELSQQRSGGAVVAAAAYRPHGSAFSSAFLLPSGKILTCLERLSGWYGQRHLRMTAKAFNFSRWLDSEGRRVPKELHSAHVMGWTPQILSVRALDEMEAELVARVPVAADPGREPLANATFRRLSNSTQWTEYFTYHLALDALGAWGRYHENMCAARGTRIEPSSGRCVSELTDAALGGADEPARVLGALAIAPNASRSFALPGCLKVRVDCVQELLLEQGHSVVPFITINDHKVTGEQAVRAVRAKLDDHTPRPSRSVSLRPPAHRCCGMNFVLWRNVFGPLSFPTVRTFDAACGS